MLTGSLLVLFAVLATAPASPAEVPDFRDLTIKTHTTMDSHHNLETTWYFKGARMRSEMQDPESANWVAHANIYQCDQGTRILLNESSKTYSSFPADPTQLRETVHPAPEIPLSGGEVTVTTDSVDSGERRQVGSYQARHIKTTITVEPGPEAVSHKSATEIDGWYLDLPGLYCQDNSRRRMGWSTAWPGRRDRIVFKQIGTAPRGFAIEETITTIENGNAAIHKTKLLDISEKPLDESLFEIPAGYSEASTKAGP